MKIVEKPWGREIWWAVTPYYVGKILEVNKGCRLSLQYHALKHETQYLESGSLKLTIGPFEGDESLKRLEVRMLATGDCVEIPPRTVHRIEAIEDCRIYEVSTIELDDVVRLKDDYQRAGSTDNT